MANILMVYDSEDATHLPFAQMSAFGSNFGCQVRKQYTSRVSEEEIDWSDVIIAVCCNSPISYAVLRFAREKGRYLIYFLDDDLKDLPKTFFWYPQRRGWCVACAKQCAIMFSGSQLIIDEYKAYVSKKKGVICNTEVSENEIVRVPSDSECFRLVYAASEGHIVNFQAYIEPILPSLFDKYKYGMELYFIGLHPTVDLGAYNKQIHYVPSMPLSEYNQYMQTHHFDIGLAPLITNHVTERKYFNKYIEYSKVGICGVYSAVMPYQLVVRDGWNGLFAQNTAESWLETIEKAMDNASDREKIIKTSQQHLRDKHNVEWLLKKLHADIPELTDFTATERITRWAAFVWFYKLWFVWFRVCESIYLSFISLKRYGARTTATRIIQKLRRVI